MRPAIIKRDGAHFGWSCAREAFLVIKERTSRIGRGVEGRHAIKWSSIRELIAGSAPSIVSVVVWFLALIVATTFGHDVRAQSTTWDLPELQKARAATARWDCRTAWEILWPLAKGGNNEARYLLMVAKVQNTAPPGTNRQSSAEVRNRHSLTLAAYAALAQVPAHAADPNHRWLRESIPIYLRDLSLGSNGDRVAQCYASGRGFRDCLELAVSIGIVPTFEEYAEQVEAAEQRTGMPASCNYPH